jgi:hypothetical protein
MNRKEAEQIVFEAAQSWRVELDEYIIPGVMSQEEVTSYTEASLRLEEALGIVRATGE